MPLLLCMPIERPLGDNHSFLDEGCKMGKWLKGARYAVFTVLKLCVFVRYGMCPAFLHKQHGKPASYAAISPSLLQGWNRIKVWVISVPLTTKEPKRGGGRGGLTKKRGKQKQKVGKYEQSLTTVTTKKDPTRTYVVHSLAWMCTVSVGYVLYGWILCHTCTHC